ncbi:hypothetical protein MOX02_35060 [Methylobacterium oxalidis]|uniref:Uncharacterized protein n=3 Tax=Methylobacterium oxalidis TaxID=944322 RepID=A0A512J667_9HYPH|nr:hypothetical protein MOX02_35060 [Methylobacterium oxalidis]
MSRMMQRDPIPALRATSDGSDAASGTTLPFLPTLATAVAIAALSLLCREPSAPAAGAASVPVQAVLAEAAPLIDALSFRPPVAGDGSAEAVRAPAALAFAQVYPLLPCEPRVAAAPARAPRLAAARRTPCSACSEAGPRRSDAPPATRAAEAPVDAEEAMQQEETLLPRLALPFAPAVRAVDRAFDRAAGFVRTGASALGGSVSVVVDRLR